MKKSMLALFSIFVLFHSAAKAGLKPMQDQELSSVAAAGSFDIQWMQLLTDFQEYAANGDQNLSADQIQKFLEDRARFWGLSLNDISVQGLHFNSDVPITLAVDGETVAVLRSPSQIDSIQIGAVKVGGSNPANKSFGSISINNIDLTGTSIYLNFRSTH